MSAQKVVASIYRNGIVRIDLKCADGALPLCSGSIRAVTSVVERHCNLCYDGKGYKFGSLALEDDDHKALEMVTDLSRKMTEDVAYNSFRNTRL
ncbi:hypothetical protein [Oleidesulfovibrio sp.]|uniref:hypothetical protein n=1 Tax=Oleidesulfovibrio sp. TaxID=2909707 RepID=UPI003A877C87